MEKIHKGIWWWLGISACYGILIRGTVKSTWYASPGGRTLVVMSATFIFIVPFVIGYISIAKAEAKRKLPFYYWIIGPWLAVLAGIAVAALFAWEGFICIVFFAPVSFVTASLGGLTAGIIARYQSPAQVNLSVAFVALLPFIIAPIEQRLPTPLQIRSVESSIVIQASPQTVWENIERVPLISPSELPHSWNRTIGFPRPLEATLSHEGIGGVRHASFAGNVLFVETIDSWEQHHRLGFSIKADTQNIPPTSLDEHVTIGGPFFDVLHGEYILEPQSDGTVRLRLVSRHRLSTNFNWYARLWSDAVMSDVQRSILHVIKQRCERPSAPPSTS